MTLPSRALVAALLFGLALSPCIARAEAALGTEQQIDVDATNPVGTQWFVKLESNTYLLDVESFDTHRVQEKLELQPRAAIPLTSQAFLITRPTIGIFESNPYADGGRLERANGFSDIELPVVVSPALGPAWLVGVGPTFVLPTATSDHTGQGKWQSGPAAVLGWKSDTWLAALFGQQFWSFAGSSARQNVSRLKVQYFLSRFFADGWSVGMSPTILADWKADGGQQLTFPVGLGVSKVVKYSGALALKLGVQVDYMPIHPDEFGQEARLQVTITPVFPQPFREPLLPAR